MTYIVRLTREALEELQLLEAFLLEAALEHGDWPDRALLAIRGEFRILGPILSPVDLPSTIDGSENSSFHSVLPLGGEVDVAIEVLGQASPRAILQAVHQPRM